MDLIVEWIKRFFIPGSVSFLVIGVAIGTLLLLRDRKSRWGLRLLLGLLVLYWILSTPACVMLLEDAINGDYQPLRASDMTDIEAIVVLGGGTLTYEARGYQYGRMGRTTTLRVLEAVRLYHLGQDPLVIVSGGSDEGGGKTQSESEVMFEVMLHFGIPAERLVEDKLSGNTLEEAINIAQILDELEISRFVLVTSPTHMPRSLAVFQAQGLDPVPAVAQQHPETVPLTSSLLPTEQALEASHGVFREIMATIYYWMRGWFRPVGS
jgi:uncharacterized SAM-binding protein YcdF (DUF218 family)